MHTKLALRARTQVLKSKPDHLQALQYKSQVLADQQKFKDAIACIDEILKSQPGNVDFLRLKINYLNVSKEHEEALEACEIALKTDADNLSVRGVRARSARILIISLKYYEYHCITHEFENI